MMGSCEKQLNLLVSLFIIPSNDALWDLVPFVQFKKREKHTWSSVTFSKAKA